MLQYVTHSIFMSALTASSRNSCRPRSLLLHSPCPSFEGERDLDINRFCQRQTSIRRIPRREQDCIRRRHQSNDHRPIADDAFPGFNGEIRFL